MFHQVLTVLSLRHANFRLFLVWTPVDTELGGQWLARDWAAQGCTRDPPDGLNRINSASYQKARARTLAFNAWGHRWWRRTTPSQALMCSASARTTPQKTYPALAARRSGTPNISYANAPASAKVDPVKAVRDRLPTVADQSLTALTRAWVDSGIYSTRPGHPVSLPSLQSLLGTRKGIGMLLAFFDQMRTLSAPETSPPLPVPPEPD
ncbi:hypothetical protein EDB92DRAFT_1821071 [Lactarius akahatsu]|uniref:Uncharacterized protein n=1 Tax=Lactarius akahatsu TaxID=416441 RepID=A0AAD4LAV1_9AGAM|nr:hypothetical protein EDB92DRAFT_1821071 [Lactarius akahatsu]